MKRRFRRNELGLPTIIKVLNDFNYKIIALPPVQTDVFPFSREPLSDRQIKLLKTVGYFDSINETPSLNGAIDFLRRKFEIPCAVNLCWDSRDNRYKYTYVYLDVFKHNKQHSGAWFENYADAASHLLDELLALDL
jgi:hypothetical protein